MNNNIIHEELSGKVLCSSGFFLSVKGKKPELPAEAGKQLFTNEVFRLRHIAFSVHNILGPGLLEHCYQEACCIELRRMGIPYEREKVFALEYKGEMIGGYRADLVVDDKVILELKAVQALSPAMEAQTINYLRLSKIPVGYLINFHGTRVAWKRFAYTRE